MSKAEQFSGIANELACLYAKKDADYGDSFGRSVEKYGIITALTRLSDKFNRAENLILKGNANVRESLRDTLLDMAAYAIMTVIEIENPINLMKE